MHEPSLGRTTFLGSRVAKDLAEFKLKSDIIVANRASENLVHVEAKVFSRDVFGNC